MTTSEDTRELQTFESIRLRMDRREAAEPQREAKARRKREAERQQREDVAGLKVRTTRSDVVLGLVVAWQIVLTVGLLYALTGQPAEQPADQATCPSPDE